MPFLTQNVTSENAGIIDQLLNQLKEEREEEKEHKKEEKETICCSLLLHLNVGIVLKIQYFLMFFPAFQNNRSFKNRIYVK